MTPRPETPMKLFLHAITFRRSFRVRFTKVRLAQFHLAPASEEWRSGAVSWLDARWIADMSALPFVVGRNENIRISFEPSAPSQETPRIRLLSALLCCGGAGYIVVIAALLSPLTRESLPALIPGPFLIALGLFGAGRSKS